MADKKSRVVTRRRVVALGSASVLTPVSGCLDSVSGLISGRPPIDEVDVRFQDIRKPSIGVSSITLPVLIELHNAAQDAIPSPAIEADVFIMDEQVATSETTVTTLDPGEEATTSLDVIIKGEDLSQSLIDAIRSGEFSIRLEGEISSEGASKSFSVSTT
ncbi:hypothetical protein KI372_00435 [Halobacterium salinarum]|uniref:hypothetical protein n=1 Tax=Halobacterium salinarum TaxID=2242 RepID=UPI001F397046|nr:hypothetical protein [Halobacterium salinarum]MCF2206892.1 hypothetical protein [Halobacterium salinarum]MCF2239938.1 hypothetical protein [Halobacterium salinarum]